MPVSKSFSANTKIKSADINTNFSDVDDKFDTSTGHEHNGTDSKLLYENGDYRIKKYVPILQGQSATVLRATITGITTAGAGAVGLWFGGNAPADRVTKRKDTAFIESGGNLFFGVGPEFGVYGGGIAAWFTFSITKSGQTLYVSTVTTAFGGGNVEGLLGIDFISSQTGIIMTL